MNNDILDQGGLLKEPYFPLMQIEEMKDPVIVDWTPANGGGKNFKSNELIKLDSQIVVFKATSNAYFFAGIFMVTGIFPIFYGLINFEIVNLVLGLIFFSVGYFMYDEFSNTPIFNKNSGLYRLKKIPLLKKLMKKIGFSVRLKDIKSIQLLSEYVRGDKSRYHSYEINLILKDGHRINVVDHGDRQSSETDAQALAYFLDVPFLNGLHEQVNSLD